MDTQTRELVAIGASTTANCVTCVQFHVKQAREAGVSDKEIQAAIRVGRMVRKGAAEAWDREVEALLGPAAERPACGCGS